MLVSDNSASRSAAHGWLEYFFICRTALEFHCRYSLIVDSSDIDRQFNISNDFNDCADCRYPSGLMV